MGLSDNDPNELADFGEHVATLLGGTELSSIDSNVRTDLLTAIGTLPATLATLTSDAQIAQNAAEAAIASRNEAYQQLIELMRQVRNYLVAGNAPKEQWDLCGFDFPDNTRSTYNAQVPTELTLSTYSPASVRGKFKGNNSSASVLYEIWRREGDEGPWGLRMAVKTTSFSEDGMTPGQYYEYRVRAKASKTTSDFSASAVCYGVN